GHRLRRLNDERLALGILLDDLEVVEASLLRDLGAAVEEVGVDVLPWRGAVAAIPDLVGLGIDLRIPVARALAALRRRGRAAREEQAGGKELEAPGARLPCAACAGHEVLGSRSHRPGGVRQTE